MDLKNIFGEVIFSAAVETIAELVSRAVAAKTDLYGASLDGARLDGASLVRASLVRASLDGARLDGASLVHARLDGARLDGASLVRARLDGASLDGARLDGASLDGASLDGASLVRARLDGASLVHAKLPSPTVVLLACWGEVPEQLCADLMEYDCWNHGDRAAFDDFAMGGRCPYSDHLEERAARFHESGEIWKKGIGKLCSPRDLMLRLFAEKNIKR